MLPRGFSIAHIASTRQNSELIWKLLTKHQGVKSHTSQGKNPLWDQRCLPSTWALIGEVIPLPYKSRPMVGLVHSLRYSGIAK